MTLRARSLHARLARNIFHTMQRGAAARTELSGTDTVGCSSRPSGDCAPVLRGRARSPLDACPHADWASGPRPDLSGLSARQRARLAEAWLADAMDAHRKIALGAQLSLEFLSQGAPPELLRSAQRASLDHITHAEICFGLASAYRGRPAGPPPGPGQSGAEPSLAVTVRHGCMGDTIAAMVATVAAEGCQDPVVRRALHTMASDRTRHAGLAWRFVAWSLRHRREPADPRHIADTFAVRAAELGVEREIPRREGSGWLASHGRLSGRQLQEITSVTLREVVLPCAHALLSPD